jgi:hypothetical protein
VEAQVAENDINAEESRKEKVLRSPREKKCIQQKLEKEHGCLVVLSIPPIHDMKGDWIQCGTCVE